MASESLMLRDDHGRRIYVGHTQQGKPCVSITDGMTSVMAVFSGERLRTFTEAVDRLAMPGQEGRRDDGEAPAMPGQPPAYACCEHCKRDSPHKKDGHAGACPIRECGEGHQEGRRDDGEAAVAGVRDA